MLASDHLGEVQKGLWLVHFRRLPKYQANAAVYADTLLDKLDETEGTIKARMLNALMKEINDLGPGEVSIGAASKEIPGAGRGDRDGTYWFQTNERNSLIEEALAVLYDDIGTLVTPSPGTEGNYGTSSFRVAVGNRKVHICCPVCNVQVVHHGGYGRCGCN